MNWTDILVALQRQESGSISPELCNEIAGSGRLSLEGTPSIRIFRQSQHPHSFSTPHGNGSYDAYGSLLMSGSDPYPDAIYADDTFYTRVGCPVTLSEACSLNMKPAQTFRLKNLFRRTTGDVIRWSMKADLPETITDEILRFLKTQNQECLKYITIQLIPSDQTMDHACTHSLIITTKLLPDNLNGFCLLNDFYPFGDTAKNGADFDAACLLVDGMVTCCRSIFAILTQDCSCFQ